MFRLHLLLLLLMVAAVTINAKSVDELRGELLRVLERTFLEEEEALKHEEKRQSTCTQRYKDLYKITKVTHGMCKHTNPAATNPGVSSAERQEILDFHNSKRAKVQPPAGDMQKMYWDDDLAAIAQHYAETCPQWHDQAGERAHPVYHGNNIWVGQNIAQGRPSWDNVLNSWWDEVKLYTYGRNYPTMSVGNEPIGHYTQQAHATASRIGCGYADCPGVSPYSQYSPDKNIFACNYLYGQSSDVSHPYKSDSSQAAACPKFRKNGLCDCDGLICYEGGTPDVSTCTCKCPKMYGGRDCGKVICPEEDLSHCTEWWRASDCTRYTNVPEECPYMCGLCKPGDFTGGKTTTTAAPTQAPTPAPTPAPTQAPSDGKGVSTGGNNNAGSANEIDKINTAAGACPHVDPTSCRGIQPKHCNAKYTEQCPNACGKCEERCPGMKHRDCYNEGHLGDDCKCECPPAYGGPTCEKYLNCPVVDDNACGDTSISQNTYVRENCGRHNVLYTCPIMCEICPVVCGDHTPQSCINGVVERADCKCHCNPGYTGEDCYVLISCPVDEDPSSCDQFSKDGQHGGCSHSEIRGLCPYMCGVCKKDKREIRRLMRKSRMLI